jgi:hypothetical protein
MLPAAAPLDLPADALRLGECAAVNRFFVVERLGRPYCDLPAATSPLAAPNES